MFATVAGRYDFCNRLLSFRRDVYWRREMVRTMRFFKTGRYLDLACGTCDVAIQCVCDNPQVNVVAIDFVPEMIAAAKKKLRAAGLQERIVAETGDATDVRQPDESFDTAGMAFGIRNIPDRLQALCEMHRTVVPGGRVVILELVMPRHRLIKAVYALMLKTVMPVLAAVFASNRDAYSYLGSSILAFPADEEFMELMRQAGLKNVAAKSLTFGVCRVFSGEKV